MWRIRWTTVALAASLALACGCNCFSNRFGPARGCPCPLDCDVGAVPFGEGPVLQDYGPYAAAPGAVPGTSSDAPMPLMPQQGVPPLSPTPRLVPEPQPQAQPAPYRPTFRRDLR